MDTELPPWRPPGRSSTVQPQPDDIPPVATTSHPELPDPGAPSRSTSPPTPAQPYLARLLEGQAFSAATAPAPTAEAAEPVTGAAAAKDAASIAAFKSASISKVNTALNHGVDLNCKDDAGKTALYYATLAGNTRLVKILLKAGANVDDVILRDIPTTDSNRDAKTIVLQTKRLMMALQDKVLASNLNTPHPRGQWSVKTRNWVHNPAGLPTGAAKVKEIQALIRDGAVIGATVNPHPRDTRLAPRRLSKPYTTLDLCIDHDPNLSRPHTKVFKWLLDNYPHLFNAQRNFANLFALYAYCDTWWVWRGCNVITVAKEHSFKAVVISIDHRLLACDRTGALDLCRAARTSEFATTNDKGGPVTGEGNEYGRVVDYISATIQNHTDNSQARDVLLNDERCEYNGISYATAAHRVGDENYLTVELDRIPIDKHTPKRVKAFLEEVQRQYSQGDLTKDFVCGLLARLATPPKQRLMTHTASPWASTTSPGKARHQIWRALYAVCSPAGQAAL